MAKQVKRSITRSQHGAKEPPVAASRLPEKERPLLWLVLMAYTLFVCMGVWHHEPWRDEAQAWLLARDIDLPGLFRILPAEGHPPLWYLLLMPLAKAGLPYMVQNWLAAAIMLAAVYMLLFRLPFHLIIRLLLPFSFFFLFEYVVFARNYCLVVLFIFMIVDQYPKRFERPWLYALLVVGLFNTHVLVFIFGMGLLGLYVFEAFREKRLNKNITGSILLMIVGGVYLLPYLATAKMTTVYKNSMDHVAAMYEVISGGILVSDYRMFSLILLLLLVLPLIKRPHLLIVLLAGLAGVLYILAYKYTGAFRHYGILFLEIIAVWGLVRSTESTPSMAERDFLARQGHWFLLIPVLLQLKPAWDHYLADMERPYSGAKGAAEFLIENNLEDRIIIGHQAWAASAVLPYLHRDKRFYYAECERYGSYYIYDSCFIKNMWTYPVDYSVNITYKNFSDRLDSVVLLFNHAVEAQAGKYLDLIYKTDEQAMQEDENFYIYRFKPQVR